MVIWFADCFIQLWSGPSEKICYLGHTKNPDDDDDDEEEEEEEVFEHLLFLYAIL